MPRKPRIVVPGLAHHVTQRGNNRQDVFEDDKDYANYCRWINKYSALNKLEILAYCLMPNHVHFIVVPQDSQTMSKWAESGVAGNPSSRLPPRTKVRGFRRRRMNGKRETSGHLWQGRFYSCALDEAHFYRAVRYVERNPIRSDLATKAWNYPWSSAKWHTGLTSNSAVALGKTTIVCQEDWVSYLSEGDEEFEKAIRIETRKGWRHK